MFYIIYIISSIKYRNNPMILKYITFCYMLLLIFIMEICLTLSIASRRNLLGILSGFLFVIVCYYLMRTVPRKIRESVEKKETFVPLSALFTEKVSDGLIFIGGTGITAFLVLFDRSTGSDTRGQSMLLSHLLCLRCFYLLYMSFPLTFWEAIIFLNILNNIGNNSDTQLKIGMVKSRKNIREHKISWWNDSW